LTFGVAECLARPAWPFNLRERNLSTKFAFSPKATRVAAWIRNGFVRANSVELILGGVSGLARTPRRTMDRQM
jgi:hypothetical protein